ncbi:MAG TPA: hypothetical protein VJ846_04935 [Sphingomicrobium sp.]|nr:hypothetical protein [Sphingomicrobium sp.]
MTRRRNKGPSDAPLPSPGSGADEREWSIRRIDIRSPLSQLEGHLVRIEMEHPKRGRVTDMGSGLDIIGAAVAAVAHILGCKASIVSLHSSHRRVLSDDGIDPAMAAIVVECDGQKRRGTATGRDLVYASLAAFIHAVASGEARDTAPLSPGLNRSDNCDLLAARPCQVSGIDENGDFWLFASDDPGAAQAIADEFGQDDYQSVSLSLPPAPTPGSAS